MKRNYRKIKAWKHAHELTLAVYRQTQSFPREEIYGITSQVRRSAASVAANIAEGSTRSSKPDYLRFLEIALGSLRETDYLLLLASDLAYLSDTQFDPLFEKAEETARTLTGLIDSVRNDP